MRLRARLGWLSMVGVLAAGAVGLRAQPGNQSGKPSVDGSMAELVAEVRALRLAVERTGEVTARSQTLLGRVQLQENRLADLGRRLDDARQRVRIATAQATAQEMELTRVLGTFEGMPAGDPERVHMEREARTARTRVKAAQNDVAQLRAEEQEMLSALSTEQSRWSDYNERLEAIEREVVARKP